MKIYAECEYCGKKFEKKFGDEYIRMCKLHELKEHSSILVHSRDIIKNEINYYNNLYNINITNGELVLSINYINIPVLQFDIKYKDNSITTITIELDNKGYDSKSYLEELLREKIENMYKIYANYLLEKDEVLKLQDEFNNKFKIGQYVQKEIIGVKQCVCKILDIENDEVKLHVIVNGIGDSVDKIEYVKILELVRGSWYITDKPKVIHCRNRRDTGYHDRYRELYKEMRDIYGEDAAAIIRELECVKGWKI